MSPGRRVKDGLRAGAAALGVAAGFMVLASTSQTPDGFIHASFGGPMDVFSPAGAADVFAVGDVTADGASEINALLKGPTSPTAEIPDSPIRAAFEAGATAAPSPLASSGLAPFVSPTAAPALKDAAILPVKPVVSPQGTVDCTGSVSCKTDPTTKITTVTYPDGVVAIVQKVNDLTVVAYKTLTDVLPDEVKALLPPVPTSNPVVLAAPPPVPATIPPVAPAPPPSPPSTEPSLDSTAPSFDPGPIAPEPDGPDPAETGEGSGPRINVVRPPMDFSPDSNTGGGTAGSNNGQKPDFPVLGKVKDALDSAVDAVTGAVGKALKPGASAKPTGASGEPAGPADSPSQNPSPSP